MPADPHHAVAAISNPGRHPTGARRRRGLTRCWDLPLIAHMTECVLIAIAILKSSTPLSQISTPQVCVEVALAYLPTVPATAMRRCHRPSSNGQECSVERVKPPSLGPPAISDELRGSFDRFVDWFLDRLLKGFLGRHVLIVRERLAFAC